MPDQLKDLEPRTRALENQFSALRAGVLVLAACSVAFLGIEHFRIPSVVHGAISDKIGQNVLEDITAAKALADGLIKSSNDTRGWDEKEKKGFFIIGQTLICFGTHPTTTPASAGWTRQFKIEFPREFASPPTVTVTPIAKGSGETFGIYTGLLPTTKGCEGFLNTGAQQGTPVGAEVSISYIAIGPAPVPSAPST